MNAFLGLGFAALFFIIFAVLIVPMVFYLLTLQRALQKCSPQNRSQSPGLVWLEIIPVVGLVWQFVNVLAIGKSLGNEFRARRIPADPAPGQSLGLAMCIVGVCAVIPYVGTFAALAHLVLFIIYWVKVAGFSGQLDRVPGALPPYPGYANTIPAYVYPVVAQDRPYLSGGPDPRQVGAAPAAPSQVSPSCPQCGTPAAQDDRFCKRCGAQFGNGT
jgi:hypothetical protein